MVLSYSLGDIKMKAKSSNVKFPKKYERFGEIIRYLTADELNQFFDSIDNYYHKLMFRLFMNWAAE